MIDIDNKTAYAVNEKLLNNILLELTQKEVELIVTSNEHIQTINKEYRGVDKSTDVLSFPYETMPMVPLGSIVISIDYVKSKAAEFGHSEDDEFALLFIHGMLHLLGYDHECDNGEMRAMEEKLIHEFGLPESLIVRTQG